MSREFDELLRQDAARSLTNTKESCNNLSEQQWRPAPTAAQQGYVESPLFDYFVDRPKHLSTQAQMQEAVHKTGSMGSAMATIGMMHFLNKQTRPTFEFDAKRMVLTDREAIFARRAFAPALGIYAASALTNAAVDKVFFDSKQADAGTTLIDTLTPLVLLTRLDYRFKMAAMILPHISTKWHAPQESSRQAPAW